MSFIFIVTLIFMRDNVLFVPGHYLFNDVCVNTRITGSHRCTEAMFSA